MDKKKKRGLLSKIMVFVLTLLAVIALVAMILSVLSSYLDPVRFVWVPFFGLAFWGVFFFNLLLLVLFLVFWSNKIWITVLALLIAVPGLGKSYAMGKTRTQGSLRLMSYNVRNFNPFEKNLKAEAFANRVAEVVKAQDPDILCCQEFSAFTSELSRSECISKFAEMTGMPHYYYHKKKNYGGNVLFSKYPIRTIPEEHSLGDEAIYGVVAEVDAAEKGCFYVAGVHLISNQITDDEIDFLTESPKSQTDTIVSFGKSIIVKLKRAFTKRSEQVQAILKDLSQVDKPIIVCGDFNDTPLSYICRQMKTSGFTDTFLAAGKGIGTTYAGKLPLLRIDYVWGNKQIQPAAFKRVRSRGSDHFPVILEFDVER